MVNKGVLVLGASAAVAAGIVVARRFSPSASLNRLLNGNLKLFISPRDRRVIRTIAASKRRYLLLSWPRPGIKDQQKRDLIAAATNNESTTENAVEEARLALLDPPLAPCKPKTLQLHGHSRTDDYYWLRDDDRSDPDVIAHLNAENAYTKSALSDTESLQETLYREMRGRIQEADRSAPLRSKGYWYYTRTQDGAQYPVHCRRTLPDNAALPTETDTMDESPDSSPEEILLDENAEAVGHDFYMTSAMRVSPDSSLLAYGVDTKGNEMYTLHVKDLSTGKDILSSPIHNTAGSCAWAADNTTLFYVTKDALDRPYKVWRHVIGTDPSADVCVYHEEDEAFYLGLSASRSRKFLYIHSGSAVTSDVRMLPADDPIGEWTVVLPRQEDVEYSVDDRGDQLFITIRDRLRPNSELLVAPRSDPSATRVVMPHRHDVKLEDVIVSEDYLVAFERSQGLQQAVAYALPAQGGAAVLLTDGKAIAFDEPAYELSPGRQGDFSNNPILRFHYTSLTTPDTVIDYNMQTGERAIKKVQPVLGGFDSGKYKTERIWATAPDGIKVPVSLVYRTDLAKLDGSDPLLLNAYGSYEISNDADFRSTRLSLIDRGFTFAIAHVRGGGDMGRQWYEDGKFLKKKNTFTDFIACAELLVEKRYTRPDALCIEGRSAGGLTMGAVTNMRPDLFNAVILGVPFVDCLTTMLDETIPLTNIEWEEWGNPNEETYYHYMLSYSPIDNIKGNDVKYPNMLVTAGLHDPRVGYWEPAKFVAKVRRDTAPGSLILLKCEMGAGHFSSSGRFERLKEIAIEYAFLLKCLGMIDVALKPSAAV